MPRLFGDTLQGGLLECRVLAPVGLPGCLSAMLFFIEYMAMYTMDYLLLPPVWHSACHWLGRPAMNKVQELNTGDVAIPCSTCLSGDP